MAAVTLAGLLSVVAMAGGARRGSPGSVHPLGMRIVVDVALTVLALAVLIGLATWVMLMLSIRDRGPGSPPLAMPMLAWWERLLAAGLPVVAMMAVGLVLVRTGALYDLFGPDGALRDLGLPRPPGGGASPGRQTVVDWLVVAVMVLAAVAAAAVAALVTARRPRLEPPRPDPAHTQLAELRSAGLEELRREPDPRRAVIRAYGAMGSLLASWGLPRRPSETPTEFLERALVQLGASAAAAARLTELFELAKFSDHPVTTRSKAEAIDAVSSLQAAAPA